MAAVASAARSASRAGRRAPRAGGRPDGQAGLGQHARHGRHQAEVAGLPPARSRRPSATSDCRTKWLNGPPAKAMPPVSVGVPAGVEPELALLDPHRRGEARVHLGQRDVAQRSAEVPLGGAGRARPSPARRRGAAVAVSVTADEQCRATWGNSHRSGGTPAARGPLRRADHEGRGLVHGPLAGVPAVVGVGQRAVARAGRGDLLGVTGLAEGGLGVVAGDGVEARPQRGDPSRCSLGVRRASAASAFSISAYCCTGRPDDARRALDGRHEVGRPGEDLVGRLPFLVRLGAAVPRPAPRLAAGDHDRARSRRPPRRPSAWLITSCCETPTSQRSVRARGDPMRRATVRAGSVSDHEPWGTATQSTAPSRPGAPASSAAATHGVGHEVGDGRRVRRRAEPDQDGQARVEGADGSGHDARCYGPAMATGEEGRWQAALEGFTKESFEADGKRRDLYRMGTGPAVIVISEIPGITPLVAQFGRRVAAAGCTAVLPVLFGEPGRPPTGAYALRSIGPACISQRVLRLRPQEDQPGHGVAAQAGRRRARALRRARVSAWWACASPAASPWP